MGQAFVVGVGMTAFGRHLTETLKTMTSESVRAALGDAGVQVDQIEAAFFANAIGGSITGQEMIAGQVALRDIGFSEIPIFNVENACASASSAFHLAVQSVASGSYDIVLAAGAEKMSHPDKRKSFAAIGGAADVEEVFGPDGPAASNRSYFMDLYAANALEYMRSTDCTVEDFARVVVKNQTHGFHNPRAQYGGEPDLTEILSARLVVEPFTVPMCSPISDGAAAAIVVSERVLERFGNSIRVAASVIASGSSTGSSHPNASSRAAAQAYQRAGIVAADLDLVELHDATASAEIALYEDLGLCARGAGPQLVRDGATTYGGEVVVNPSGGLLAKGHPIGATGLAQIVEATNQLLGRVEPERQVANANHALTHNAGGWVGTDNAVAAVTILSNQS